jgi:hypothetical protein
MKLESECSGYLECESLKDEVAMETSSTPATPVLYGAREAGRRLSQIRHSVKIPI